MFQLVFPQPAVLDPDDRELMSNATWAGVPKVEMQHLAASVRVKMKPHPAHEKEENVTKVRGLDMPGMQHKYSKKLPFSLLRCANSNTVAEHEKWPLIVSRDNSVMLLFLLLSMGTTHFSRLVSNIQIRRCWAVATRRRT
jgi:hypothetical protein